MKIIGDPGSCHLGSLKNAGELVKIGADCGLDAVKFQLLTTKETGNGNIGMDWEWLPELIDAGRHDGIEVFASVFNGNGIKWLRACGCQSIKFAYSQTTLYLEDGAMDFPNQFVSCDVMSPDVGAIPYKLYCIPEYPVRYMVDFEGLFPRFDGFSSHCLGIEQDLRAIEAGAVYLEKHFQGDWHSPCPDGKFALKPHQLEELVRRARRLAAPPSPLGHRPALELEG